MTTTTRTAVLTDQTTGRVPERLLDELLVRQAGLDALVAAEVDTPAAATAIAIQALITTALAAVVDGAPGALDTLKELATAIANDPTYATDIATQLAAKAPLASPSFTGTVSGITAAMVGADAAGAAATAQAAAAADATAKVADQAAADSATYVPQGQVSVTGTRTVPYLEFDNASDQASLHLVVSPGFSGPYLLGIGGDNGSGPRLLISEKATGVGLQFSNTSTAGANSRGIYGLQNSTDPTSVLARFENYVDVGGDLIEILNLTTSTNAASNLLYVGDEAGKVGRIPAATGILDWYRDVWLTDPQSGTARFLVNPQEGTTSDNASYGWVEKTGMVMLGASGSVNTWYATRMYTGAYSGVTNFQGAGTVTSTAAATVDAATWTTALSFSFQGHLGFFGTSPVARPTGTPVAAIDATTTQALVNSLRASLIALGLVA